MRLKTPVVQIGNMKIGGNNPIAIQSMTNTSTSDVSSTVKQIIELAYAGSELVRVTVNDEKAAQAVPLIRAELNKKGYKNIPLIGDFHFNGDLLLTKYPECAKSLDKYRINPGNVGHEKNFETIIKIAIKYNKPVRIGVNVGSLDQKVLGREPDLVKAMVKSALDSAKLAEKIGLSANKIVLSVKMSSIPSTVKAYKLLAEKMQKNKHYYAIHLGLTEAGEGLEGVVSSTSALALMLNEGIGDTLRVSLTPSPKESRTKEVEVCKIILQSLGLRTLYTHITSCPGCGRTDNKTYQDLVKQIADHLKKNYKNIGDIKVAVMGCLVNGPGESKSADIGISLPGKSEEPKALVYQRGQLTKTLHGKNIAKDFIKILDTFLKTKIKDIKK